MKKIVLSLIVIILLGIFCIPIKASGETYIPPNIKFNCTDIVITFRTPEFYDEWTGGIAFVEKDNEIINETILQYSGIINNEHTWIGKLYPPNYTEYKVGGYIQFGLMTTEFQSVNPSCKTWIPNLSR